MSCSGEFLSSIPVHTSQGDVELDRKFEMVCFIFAQCYVRCHLCTVGVHFPLPTHYIQRTLEACRVSARGYRLPIFR